MEERKRRKRRKEGGSYERGRGEEGKMAGREEVEQEWVGEMKWRKAKRGRGGNERSRTKGIEREGKGEEWGEGRERVGGEDGGKVRREGRVKDSRRKQIWGREEKGD